VPLARAVEPPKLDHFRPFRTTLPSPHVSVRSFGLALELLQLLIRSGEEAKALSADATVRTAPASTTLAIS
jgi:hypothetical protein